MLLSQLAHQCSLIFGIFVTPLNITGIEFFTLGLGRTGVPRGGSEEPGLEA